MTAAAHIRKDVIKAFTPFAPHETDFYKVGHGPLYPEGTTFAYSNFTARSDKNFIQSKSASKYYDGKITVFGTTASMKEIHARWDDTFFNVDKETAISRYKKRMDRSLGKGKVSGEQLAALHDLGYLPITILSIDEGERVPMKIPVYVIYSNQDEFYWLTNYLETSMSSHTWKPICNATIAFEFRRVFEKYAALTGSPKGFIPYQGHDFSYRGMSGTYDAARSNSGHLVVFKGTDTIPAIDYLEHYYGVAGSEDPIGESIVATEHAVATANILSRMAVKLNGRNVEEMLDSELEALRLECELAFIHDIISKDVPNGNLSLVCDSFDFFGVLRTLPKLKDVIEARGFDQYGMSKVVIRPDSGDPVKIVTGYKVAPQRYATAGELFASIPLDGHAVFAAQYEAAVVGGQYRELGLQSSGFEDDVDTLYVGRVLSEEEVKGAVEVLWDAFGGGYTVKGYKVVWDRVGLIYGDSISVARQEAILSRLEKKGFASCNIVLGIGSYTYNFNTRDTFGKAVKSTAVRVRDMLVELYKDPATGDKTKTSACGLLKVIKVDGEYQLLDRQQMTDIETESGELTLMYKNGVFYKNPTFVDIREKIDANFI